MLGAETECDRALLRLFQAALKGGRLPLALELAAHTHLHRSLEGALQLANHHRCTSFPRFFDHTCLIDHTLLEAMACLCPKVHLMDVSQLDFSDHAAWAKGAGAGGAAGDVAAEARRAGGGRGCGRVRRRVDGGHADRQPVLLAWGSSRCRPSPLPHATFPPVKLAATLAQAPEVDTMSLKFCISLSELPVSQCLYCFLDLMVVGVDHQ